MRENSIDLHTHYEAMYLDAMEKIAGGGYSIDDLIDSDKDNRFGLTLVARPPQDVIERGRLFLAEVKLLEPEQYFYPDEDIHITVLSVISCFDGFSLNGINIYDYVHLIKNCINKSEAFEIDFTGLTASPGAIMLRGMPATETLNELRSALRQEFKQSNLFHIIDKRYAIFTAHATVVRFRKPLRDPHNLRPLLEKYRNHSFGSFQTDTIDLVFNDWYQRSGSGKLLHRFQLQPRRIN